MGTRFTTTQGQLAEKPYFTVRSQQGNKVRTTKQYWIRITSGKHPLLRGKEKEVKQALKDPDEVRKSKSDPAVFLYYRKRGRNYLCVVVKHLNGEGYLITTYITSKMKEGTTIWIRKTKK